MIIDMILQQKFSYVSFETNVHQSSYKKLTFKMLKLFQSEKFVLTVFTNKICNTAIDNFLPYDVSN